MGVSAEEFNLYLFITNTAIHDHACVYLVGSVVVFTFC